MSAESQSEAAAATRRDRLREELAAQVRELTSGPFGRLRIHLGKLMLWTLGLFVFISVAGFFAANGTLDALLDGPSGIALWVVIGLGVCFCIGVVVTVQDRATPRKVWATQLKLMRYPASPLEAPVAVPPELIVAPHLAADPLLRAHPEMLEKSDRTLRRMLKPGTRQHHDATRLAAYVPGYLDAVRAELARRGRVA